MLAATVVGALIVLLMLPMAAGTRLELIRVLGLVFSAAVALSATTFLGNALAGFMLRAVRNFRIGDFIRCGEHFGRVSERGLLHTEIQTEDRELTTLPNLYLVTHPVTTIRTSGTVLSATVSLGYDIPRAQVEEVLLEAARKTELEDPFVQILELGDFSVTYRAAGILTDVKRLVSVRSHLRGNVMDALHDGKIEIVSPTFMNQRRLSADQVFRPRPTPAAPPSSAASTPDEVVFDKADEAESLEALRETCKKLEAEIEQSGALIKETPEGAERDRLHAELQRVETRRDYLERLIAQREAEAKGTGP